jgi:hypothetical protein
MHTFFRFTEKKYVDLFTCLGASFGFPFLFSERVFANLATAQNVSARNLVVIGLSSKFGLAVPASDSSSFENGRAMSLMETVP